MVTLSVIIITAIWSTVLCNTTFSLELPQKTSRRIVCYYTFPSSISDLQPQNIDPTLCSHILIGFCSINNLTIHLSANQEKVIEDVVKMKKQNSDLKVMLSVGGGSGTYGFPKMADDRFRRAIFIQSAHLVMKKFNLDGIDLDWEFPNNVLQNEKNKFIELLEDIRQNVNNSERKYLLSVAVASSVRIVELSYDIPEINRFVDFVNVMAYDYNFFSVRTPWTGINAPLYARSADVLYFATKNINFTSNYWIRKGMNKEKVNIGLPVYARTYTLKSPNNTYLDAPASGIGKLGGGGSVKYGTVCDFMNQQKLKPVFDEETKSPYVTNGSEWISFEHDQSMNYKAKYIYDNHFGGVMVFSLSSDDHKGRCKQGETFPNTRIIHKIFTQ